MTKAPPRPSMSKARRLRIWERDRGVCYMCEEKVQAGERWSIEHKRPWAESFDDSDENLGVVHEDRPDCHPSKTKADVKRIAKAKAQGGETGQWARRQKNGPKLRSGPSNWPKGRKIESRGFDKRR